MMLKQIIRLFSLMCFLLTMFSLPPQAFAFHEEDIIDIRGFNYGRLQIALKLEKNPRADKTQMARVENLLKKHLMWSGLFDIKKIYDKIDLIVKIRFIPNYELRVWIFSPENLLLFDHKMVVKSEESLEPASIKMIEEIIFQLTGERSILRSAIAYVEKDETSQYRIVLTDAFGEKRFVLINDNRYNILPRWNPKASSLLFTTLGQEGSHLRQLVLATGKIKSLFKNLGPLSGGTWANSGNELVITRSTNGNSDLFKIDLEGNIVSRITFRSTTEANPRLSPDGQRLLFVSNRSGSVQIYQRILASEETFRMTFEGSNNFEPNWSNDSAYIVFSGIKDNRFQIFLMDKEGDFLQQVTNGVRSAEQPIWSPNGRQILYVSKIGQDQKLFVIRADGSFNRRLSASGPGINEFNPTWTANYKWPINK